MINYPIKKGMYLDIDKGVLSIDVQDVFDSAYAQGRTDTVNELSAIKNFCDDCYMEFCEGCKHNGEYAFEIQKKLEQLKKSQERYEDGMQ